MAKAKKQPAPANDGFSLISNQKLIALYSSMRLCRKIAEKADSLDGKRRQAGSVHSILGHEAAVVGSVVDLLAHDTVAPALWPEDIVAAINPSVAIGSRISVAASATPAGQVTVLFSAGNRGSQTAWAKAMALAADRNLPILFVSLGGPAESSFPASPGAAPPHRNGYAFPSIAVDGNDVVAVYRVASEAIAHARKGHGPTLIECRRSASDDPIENMKTYLIRKGLSWEPLTA
jgi:TPP-dependent pyruvate/acetoin dehydrogenase alpha subunit